MAKKKKSVDYSQQNIIFTMDKKQEKLMRFMPDVQAVELKCMEPGSKGTHEVAFAHLPKEIKQLVKPLKGK